MMRNDLKTHSYNLELHYPCFDKQFASIETGNSAGLPSRLIYTRFVRKTRGRGVRRTDTSSMFSEPTHLALTFVMAFR